MALKSRDKQTKMAVCCSTQFYCGNMTNECPDCGSQYNWAGQGLIKDWTCEADDYRHEGDSSEYE